MTYYYYNERGTRQFFFLHILYFRWSFFPTSTRSKSSFVSMKNVAFDLYTHGIGSWYSYAYFNRTPEPIGTISAVLCVFWGFLRQFGRGRQLRKLQCFCRHRPWYGAYKRFKHTHTHTRIKTSGCQRWTCLYIYIYI